MQETKIQFSPHEIELLKNPDWILTKNSVMQKMAEGMGALSARMQEAIGCSSRLPREVVHSNPKLSRGENYRGLPYLMLDYPRIFGKEDILAIRTFFWWGHFCSITLHVRGVYRIPVREQISFVGTELAQHEFYASTGGDEWNHDVTSDDYERVTDLSSAEFVTRLFHGPFNKLSAKVELTQWKEMEEKLFRLFSVLLKMMSVSG